jgi:4-amino-4-deoxy-L-arabinose transferase-like glycosyltransferase
MNPPTWLRPLLICAAASLIWLPNLGTTPSWDWDEGYNLNYAWNISEGRLLWFSIKYAFVPHPPLYLLLAATLVKLFGQSILVIRLLSVALNFAIIFALYLIGREVGGERTGLAAAALFTVYPAALYWGRMGFANHLLSLLTVLSLYCLIKHLKAGGRWWIPCCLLAGSAAVTEPQGLFTAAAILVYFTARRENNLQAAALLFGPFIIYASAMTLISPYFVSDSMYQMQRFGLIGWRLIPALFLIVASVWKRKEAAGFIRRLFEEENQSWNKDAFSRWYVPASLLAAHLLTSITLVEPPTGASLFAGGEYYWLGIIGLLLADAYMAPVVLLYLMPAYAAVLAFGRADHMLIPLYPFFALGVAVLVLRLYSHFKRIFGVSLTLLVLAYPFAFAAYNGVSAYAFGGVFGAEPVSDLEAVSAYVESHSRSGDFVVTTTNLARFFRNSTDITQSIVYEGYDIEYYRGYQPGRFAFNCSYRNAAYAVVPEGMLDWFGKYAPGPAEEIGGWDVVNRSGGYLVYRNPTSV